MQLIAPPSRAAERGSALAVSLVVVTLIAGLGAGLVSIQSSINRRHAQSVQTKQALYVAEAGLSEAFAAIAVGKSGSVGSATTPAIWGHGVYWVEAVEDAEGNYHLNSTGLVGGGRRSITAVVRPGSNPAAESGVYGLKGVTIGEGAILDGYDSEEGNYDPSAEPAGARITSNGDVILNGDLILEGESLVKETFVYGDVRPGIAGVIVAEPGVAVSGSTLPLEKEAPAPSIPVPEIGTSSGAVNLSGGTLTDVEVRYDSLRVDAGTTLRITGPVTLVVDNLDIDGNLELDGGPGKIEVFVLQTLRMRTGSTLETVSNAPTGVGVFVGALGDEKGSFDELVTNSGFTADEVEGALAVGGGLKGGAPAEDPLVFEPTGTFKGLIYAPFSDLTIPTNLRVFGAVAGKTLTLDPGARVTFDEGLISASLGMAVLPELLSWQVVELPDEDLVISRLDPLLTLKLQGTTPTASPSSHKESIVQMKYWDSTKTQVAYSGDINALDWTNVLCVKAVQWQDPDTLLYSKEIVPAGVMRDSDKGFLALTPK